MPETAATIFREFETDGVPSSGKHKPKKSEIRSWGAYLESFISAIGASGSAIYLTRAELFADLSKTAKSSAWVIQDATVAYNGVYRKNGAAGTGSWSRVSDLPFSFIVATDAGAGLPDAIQATTPLPVSPTALVILNIFDTNSGSPVTVSFNGAAPLTIKSNSGNDIVAGGLVAGMMVLGVATGSNFRLVNDQVSSAIVAAAEASQVAAEAAEELAEGYAAGLHLPPILSGDAGKMLEVRTDESGYQLVGRLDDAEKAYWADKAALLDPNAYVWKDGTSWTLTVPDGKSWYLLNGWSLRMDGGSFDNFKWHHRDLDIDQAMQLPSGFKLSADDYGFAYYADPSLVQAGDDRYVKDPKGLYFSRLERLRTAPLEMIGMLRPVGTAAGTLTVNTTAQFPAEHTRMLVRHIDCHDGCWVVLYKGSGAGTGSTLDYAMNTQDELDDVRPMRFTQKVLAPISRANFNGAWLGHGNASGNSAGTQTYVGWGSVHYNVLPSDW